MSRAADPLGIDELDPVSLEDLNQQAALLRRTDRKYLVPLRSVDTALRRLRPDARVLEISGARSFRYETVYFDTPQLITYLDSARSRPRRFKVRTRSYLDSGRCVFEVKERDVGGATSKHQMRYEFNQRHAITAAGRNFLDGFSFILPIHDRLLATLTTSYERTTLLLETTASRVTIDTNLVSTTTDGLSFGLPELAFVETKSRHQATMMDRALWQQQHRPISVSKYCTSLAALRADLPANKWHRTLKQYFGPARQSVS